MKKKILVNFVVCKNLLTSVILSCSYFWFCLLNFTIYTHHLYSKECSTRFKPLSTPEGVLVTAFCASIVSKLGIHNTKSYKAFVRNVIKEHVTLGDVKFHLSLFTQIFELGTILSAKTTLPIVIGIFFY